MAMLPTMPTDKLKPNLSPSFIRKCTCCGNEYDRVTDFFLSPSTPLYRNNGNRMPVCRNCVEQMYNDYKQSLGEDEAVRRICMKFDLFFSLELVESCRASKNNRSLIANYITRCHLPGYIGKTYDTTMRMESNVPVTTFDDIDVQDENADFVVTEEIIYNWGPNFSPSQYRFLENDFNDWRSKCVISGKAKEALVRDLCILKLQQNQALLDGKIDLYTKLTDTFQKTLDRAELTPKIESANDKAAEKPLGVMIKMFEEHDPIPEPLEEWKDPDRIKHFLSIYVLGHLMKMLGIKNPHADLYEREMQKYRVDIPELQDVDDEDVFESILSDISDKIDAEDGGA